MKIKITGDAFVVESSIKAKDIELVKKYAPEALTIKDEEKKNDLFSISYNESASGSIAPFGVTFNSKTKDANGYISFTGMLPKSVKTADEAKAYVADLVGAAATHLATLEKTIPEKAAALEEGKKKLMEAISVS